ncbi:MAG: PorP/SprF family type IX secretion system membrane protein [Chitinophagaceae bacterium]|nr:PorP/SprF family type IX secretion system membrane protein [Chitinophagaceae bacterium]MCW5916260.1 PorP/SprF family type IX secretion system membrane protein [Ferruginibacter sp.]
MRKILFYLVATLFTLAASAQDPHFSQFFASPLTLNPAFTGKFDGKWRIAANHRDQWPSIPKAYVTTSASVDFPILASKIPEGDVFGIGISGVSDASADNALKLNYGSLSLSYHRALDEEGYNTIGAGFQGTYSSMTIDPNKLTFEDQLTQNGFTRPTNDILVNGNNQNYFDVNAGLLYSGSTNGENNYYLGVSMYHINRPKVSFKDKNWYLSGRVTIHGGGYFPVSDVVGVNTSVIYQVQNKASETILGAALSLNANPGEINPTSIYVGSWYRFNDAIIPYLGIEFAGLRIGASYDINTSSLKAATSSRGGSEFSIIYVRRKAESKGIPCPRF